MNIDPSFAFSPRQLIKKIVDYLNQDRYIIVNIFNHFATDLNNTTDIYPTKKKQMSMRLARAPEDVKLVFKNVGGDNTIYTVDNRGALKRTITINTEGAEVYFDPDEVGYKIVSNCGEILLYKRVV